jgi:hypothetical protein
MRHIYERLRAGCLRGVLLACLAALSFASAAAAPARAGEPIWKVIDKAQLIKLLEGGRFSFADRGLYPGKEVAVSGVLINAKPEQVWAAITNFENYPKMIQQVAKVETLEKNEKSARVHFYIFIIKIGPLKVQTDYIQKWMFEKPGRITVVSEPENGAKSKGDEIPVTWDLVPTPDGKHTMLFHTTRSDLRKGGMIGNYMLQREPTIQTGFDLADALVLADAVKDEVEKKK